VMPRDQLAESVLAVTRASSCLKHVARTSTRFRKNGVCLQTVV
jgi:hypothetical protein